MNHVTLIGRISRDPEVRYTQGNMAIAKYSLAVDRFKEGTDFISCVAFGKNAEFAEKYLKKGMKIALEGHIQTGSYDGKNGKVYTTDVVVDRQEFCESRQKDGGRQDSIDGFLNMAESVSAEEELPFE